MSQVTINEPEVYVTQGPALFGEAPDFFIGYLSDKYPPGVENPTLAANVLFNLLKAHIEVYKELKSLPV